MSLNINYANAQNENNSIESISVESESENQRESFLVIPFFNWQGANRDFYQKMATDKLKMELLKYPKFKLIDDEQLNDLIKNMDIEENKENIINFAREKKIKNILFCYFVENDVSFNDLTNNNPNMFLFGRKIVLQLEVFDTSKGEKKSLLTDTISQVRMPNSKNFYQTIESLFDLSVNKLVNKLDREFLISANIISKDENRIIINKGLDNGITEGMMFTFKTKDNNGAFDFKKDIYLRVIKVLKDKSEAILISNITIDKINSNTEIIETKNTPIAEGSIFDLNSSSLDGDLKVNLGSNQGIKIGKVYKVTENIEYKEKSGKIYKIGDKEKGLIYITSVDTEESIAKIARGRNDLKNGMKISDYEKSYLEPLVKLAFYSVNSLSKEVKKNNVLRISTGYEDIRYKYYFDYGINTSIYEITDNFTPDKPQNTTRVFTPVIEGLNASLGYKFPIIPEYIHLSPLLQLGFGLSDSVYRAIIFDITPKASIIFSYNRFNLWLEGGYSLNLPIRTSNEVKINSSLIYGVGLSVNF